MFLLVSTSSFACPVKDIDNGLRTIVTSPSQLTDNIKTEIDHADFMPVGLVGGALKGTFYMGKQLVDGVWKIIVTPYNVIRKM